MSEEIISALENVESPPRSSLEKLFILHGHKWLRFIRRMVVDRAEAEDVLQDSFLKMLLRNRCFDSPDETRMYVSRVICNTAIEAYHRRRRLRNRLSSLGDHPVCTESLPQPWPEMDDKIRIRLLKLLENGLSQLPPKQYQALRLTVLAPSMASMRDMGMRLGIPYSTLRDRKQQGLRKLQKFLWKGLKKWYQDEAVNQIKQGTCF